MCYHHGLKPGGHIFQWLILIPGIKSINQFQRDSLQAQSCINVISIGLITTVGEFEPGSHFEIKNTRIKLLHVILKMFFICMVLAWPFFSISIEIVAGRIKFNETLDEIMDESDRKGPPLTDISIIDVWLIHMVIYTICMRKSSCQLNSLNNSIMLFSFPNSSRTFPIEETSG